MNLLFAHIHLVWWCARLWAWVIDIWLYNKRGYWTLGWNKRNRKKSASKSTYKCSRDDTHNGKQNTFQLALNTNLHILFLIAVVSFCLLCVIMQAPSLPIPCWCCSKNLLMNLLLKSMNDPVEIRNWTHTKKTKQNKPTTTATQLDTYTQPNTSI